RPHAIGIIDGYFECVPAVWHKEILWAMTHGIHVYGSASMGALRAAELAPFGMEGVGAIFEGFRDGRLEDDDEVAVAHGPAEMGYRLASVAMVNIRSTLAAAVKERVIPPRTGAAIERIGKRLFYADRTYERLLEDAASEGLPGRELRAFREWLPHGEVNQKRLDALAMLRAMRERLAENREPKRVLYPFEYTDMWDHACRHAGRFARAAENPPDTVVLDRLLDELRLEGEPYGRARREALLRFLAVERAWQQGISITEELLGSTVAAFRRERGLMETSQVERWRAEQYLDLGLFERLMEDEARVRLMEEGTERDVASHLLDHLRVTGQYGRLLTRARDKARVLESRGLQNPALADAGLTEGELFRWYFEIRLGRSVAPDIGVYARSLGFEDARDLRRVVLREFLYAGRRS
ncbi:MAG TPA: TfuA domain-containing protein, partial [Candidatus Acidoferrum sp.]|nr:TfuA domain-containing protein [Candidatus Acidoferrum sp.]